MKILVVDDEALLVKGIRFNLQNEGYEVITGSDGLAAVQAVQDQHPDLVELDARKSGSFPTFPSSCSPPRATTWTSSSALTTGRTTT